MSPNPVHAVAPGESRLVALGAQLRAWIIRGEEAGPIVWAWAARGAAELSMVQALSEVRDRLRPRRLRGAVGLFLDGPVPPFPLLAGGREQPRHLALGRSLCDGTAAVVILASLEPGFAAAPHVAIDLDRKGDRKLARALGASYVTPALGHPLIRPLNRAIVTAPAVQWIDGERERFSRLVVDRAAAALRSLLGTLGMTHDEPQQPALRVIIKTVVPLEAGRGVVEPIGTPGDLIHAGEVAAYLGEPGRTVRQPLVAPATGVVLYLRAGRHEGGSVIGIGKLRRTLPAVERTHTTIDRGLDVGWCERVRLPELGVASLKAKIDTGARTSALHVVSRRRAGSGAQGPLLDIEIPSGRRGRTVTARVEVVEFTEVRDSGGHAERRPVIETVLGLGPIERRVRVTLTDRGDMLFPMLIGRTALTGPVRVHPSRRWLLT